MLAALDGSCRTPIAGLAEVADDRLMIEGLLLGADGSNEIRGRREGDPGDAVVLGNDLGRELRHQAAPGYGLGADRAPRP